LRYAFLYLATAAVLTATGRAEAFDFFGLKLFERQQQADEAALVTDPEPYKVSFSTGGATGPLDSAIRNASALLAGEGKPASGVQGLLALARGDYQSINAALYGQGYYGGTIHIVIDGREATTIPIDAGLIKPVAVNIAVTPGPLFHFGQLAVADPPPPTNDPSDQVPSPQSLGFVSGAPALSGVVLSAEKNAIAGWRQLGYPNAKSVRRDVVADHRTRTVDVAIALDPGSHAAFGAVRVAGAETIDPGFVAYMTGLEPGEEYDPDAVAKANKRLQRLEMFRSERIADQGELGPGGTLPIEVTVDELSGHRFGVGADYSTIDGAGLNGYWLARNVFGRAEQLRFDAAISNIAFPIDTGAFDYAIGGTFTKPGVLNPDTDLVASATAARDNLPGYEESSLTGQLGLDYAYSNQLTLKGGVEGEIGNVDDAFGNRNFALAGLYSEATLDTRDSITDPTSGYYLDATAEPYYEFSFSNPQLRTTAEARGYYGFGDDKRFVLAARLKAGAVIGPSLDEIPPDRLFFAGGGGSVRGFAYKSIGVSGPGGQLVGGRYLVEGSIEGRWRINDSFGAVAFIDGGGVSADNLPGTDDIRFGTGVGVRYYTGFGPLRADLAFPLDRRSGDPAYGLYLGLGQAF
jgi:translocation and assembly module TamA